MGALPDLDPVEDSTADLEPFGRLLVALVRQAFRDVDDPRLHVAERARARAFLRGAEPLPLLCNAAGVSLGRLIALAVPLLSGEGTQTSEAGPLPASPASANPLSC